MWTHPFHRFRHGRTAVAALAAMVLAAGLTGLGVAPAAASPAGTVHGAGGPNAVPGSYLVVLDDDATTAGAVGATAGAVAGQYRASVTHTYRGLVHGFAARMTHRQAARLAADPRVAHVEQDQRVTAMGAGEQPNPPWGLDRIDQVSLPLDNLYRYPNTGDESTVYIVDTGINFNHVEFTGRALPGTDTVGDGGAGWDCNGHGSLLASIVAGERYGVAKDATVISVRVLSCTGAGSISGVLAGLDWIRINQAPNSTALLALGGGASTTMDDAVRGLIASGVGVVTAAGGSNANACNFSPARVAEAITVGAIGTNDQRAPFSNYGPCVDLYAPGVSISGAWYTNNDIVTISGTSPAAAFAAGVSALYLTKYDGAPPAKVHDALVGNAIPPVGILYMGFIPE